jgi:hypothetical protein
MARRARRGAQRGARRAKRCLALRARRAARPLDNTPAAAAHSRRRWRRCSARSARAGAAAGLERSCARAFSRAAQFEALTMYPRKQTGL